MLYIYKCNKAASRLQLSVSNSNGQTIWGLTYPVYTENAATGGLEQDPTIIELGIMRDTDDVDGLKNYLLQQSIIKPDDELINEKGYADKVSNEKKQNRIVEITKTNQDLESQYLQARTLFCREGGILHGSNTTQIKTMVDAGYNELSELQGISFAKGGTIEVDTVLLPALIADQVASKEVANNFRTSSLPDDSKSKLTIELTDYLTDHANTLYSNSEHFKKMLNANGNKGRDNLYMFMQHWSKAWMNKKAWLPNGGRINSNSFQKGGNIGNNILYSVVYGENRFDFHFNNDKSFMLVDHITDFRGTQFESMYPNTGGISKITGAFKQPIIKGFNDKDETVSINQIGRKMLKDWKDISMPYEKERVVTVDSFEKGGVTNKIKLVVADENTLGYIDPRVPDHLNILHGSILKGSNLDWRNGPTYVMGRNIRLASEKDFNDYGVMFDGYKNSGDFEYAEPASENSFAKGGVTDEAKENRKFYLEQVRKIAKEKGYRTQGDFIFLYHGTNQANHKKIIKSAKYKAGTWFAVDEETARKYGRQSISKGEPVVSIAIVYMGSLYYNGYFSSLEDLYLQNGKYQPKDMNLFATGGTAKLNITRQKFDLGGEANDYKIEKSFYVRDTLVDKDHFNSLPIEKRKAITEAIAKAPRNYIDARTALGPDQARRMNDKQRDKLSDTALQMFRVEDEVKELLKSDDQAEKEKTQARIKELESKKLQLTRHNETLHQVYKHKLESKRDNPAKRTVTDNNERLRLIDEELSSLQKKITHVQRIKI